MISIRRVDGKRPRIAALLRTMHDAAFGDTAFVPDPSEDLWWIAYDGADPVGFAALKPSEYRGKTGYLYRVGVYPKARGQGLQRRFITTRERAARKLGWVEMVSDTNDNRPSARNLKLAGYSLYSPGIKYGYKTTKYWRKPL